MNNTNDIKQKTARVRSIAKRTVIPRQIEEALISIADIADMLADELETLRGNR
jgi:hypothetical protein